MDELTKAINNLADEIRHIGMFSNYQPFVFSQQQTFSLPYTSDIDRLTNSIDKLSSVLQKLAPIQE